MQALFGVLNVYKPEGPTSHDVVAILRKVYQLKRVGHLGTLDPLAEGVLPVCLGQATRLIEYFPTDKGYRAHITLGKTTATLDREGEILSIQSAAAITPSAVEAVLPRFVGTIAQQVPLHSAVHVNGKKLYEYAHRGQVVETPTKTVTIDALGLVDFQNAGTPHPTVVLDVQCGGGTYIRSLARDIGEALGCGAYLEKLIRTQHGLFTAQDAVALSELQSTPHPLAYLRRPADYLDLPLIPLITEAAVQQLRNGMKIAPDSEETPRLKGNALYLAQYAGEPVAVVQAVARQLKPIKVFHVPQGETLDA